MAAQIEFTLLAPYNETVLLRGDFSDWQDVPMQKDDKGIWRCEVALEDGVYAYRYNLTSVSWFWEPGQWVEMIDPWATQVDAEKNAAILRVEGGKRVIAPYTWAHDELQQPHMLESVAYELHIGEFGADGEKLGTFESVTARMDYLKELGISAVQLMPVVGFPGKASWGYNPAYPFATEATYGTPESFKTLVDIAHGHSIRIWTDMLFNHVTPDCPLTQIDSDYWFSREPTDPEFNWGPEFNYDKHDENYDRWPAWEFAGQVVDHWIQTYHIDGIRYDAVKQLNHPHFLDWITQRAEYKAGPKEFVNIAEHIPDNPEIVSPGKGMHACWHDSFCHVIRDWLCGNTSNQDSLKDALDARRRGYESPLQLINYLSNHDQPRLLNALLDAGLSADQALARYRLGVVILLTAYGLPMLRMGDEWGENRRRPDAGEVKPLAWHELEEEPGKSLYQLHRDLIALRRSSRAIQTGSVDFIWEADRALAYLRSFEEEQVLIALNLRDEALEENIGIPPGRWQQLKSEQIAEGDALALQIPPWSAQIWVQLEAFSAEAGAEAEQTPQAPPEAAIGTEDAPPAEEADRAEEHQPEAAPRPEGEAPPEEADQDQEAAQDELLDEEAA